MRAIVRGVVIYACALAVTACGGSSSHGAHHTTTASRASYSDLIGAGDDLLAQNRLGAAIQVLTEAVTESPDQVAGHYDLGLALERAGRPVLAKRQYQRALGIDPRYAPALNNLALLLLARDPVLATFYFTRLNHVRPHVPAVLLHLGLLLAAGARTPGIASKRDLREAVRRDPALAAQIPPNLRPYLGLHASAQHHR